MDALRTSTGTGPGSVGSSPTHALRRAIEAAAKKSDGGEGVGVGGENDGGGGKDGERKNTGMDGKEEQEVRQGFGTGSGSETGVGIEGGVGGAKATTLSAKSLVYRKPTEKHIEVGRWVGGLIDRGLFNSHSFLV